MEETPKKCKDIIKTARSLLNDVQFAQFGDDPKVQIRSEISDLSWKCTSDGGPESAAPRQAFIHLVSSFFLSFTGGGDGAGKNSASDH